MTVEEAALIIKSMPMDQAIQHIKSIVTGLPETTVIKGDLLIILVNYEGE